MGQLERYVLLLLVDAGGHSRDATAERVLDPCEHDGHTTARAEFIAREGGYFLEEYRDHAEKPAFTTYIVPPELFYEPEQIPEGVTWATGTLSHADAEAAEESSGDVAEVSSCDFDDVTPFLDVLKFYFGELPTVGSPTP